MNHRPPPPESDHTDDALSAWLASSSPPAPSSALRARILALAIDQTPPNVWQSWKAFWQGVGGLRIAAPAFAMALIIGMALGAGLARVTPNDTAEDDLLSLALVENPYQNLFP